jgi:hypothetical protein
MMMRQGNSQVRLFGMTQIPHHNHDNHDKDEKGDENWGETQIGGDNHKPPVFCPNEIEEQEE